MSRPTATSNRVCGRIRSCNDLEYQTAAPTAESNRECAPLTQCTPAEYDFIKATVTSDRECLAVQRVRLYTEYAEVRVANDTTSELPVRRRALANLEQYRAVLHSYIVALAVDAGRKLATLHALCSDCMVV